MRFATSRVLRASILALALQPLLTVAQQAAVPPTQTAAPPATQEPSRTFSKEQLDQMMAPIALYPDSLLSQILMASTYPADVADAAKWSKANPNQKGDDAVKAVEKELGSKGRVLLRYSGTEPKIRLLVETREEALLQPVVDRILAPIKKHLAA